MRQLPGERCPCEGWRLGTRANETAECSPIRTPTPIPTLTETAESPPTLTSLMPTAVSAPTPVTYL